MPSTQPGLGVLPDTPTAHTVLWKGAGEGQYKSLSPYECGSVGPRATLPCTAMVQVLILALFREQTCQDRFIQIHLSGSIYPDPPSRDVLIGQH